MYGIEGAFYAFEHGLDCLTQRTPTVRDSLLDQKKIQKELGVTEMEDLQVQLWQSVCPLLDGYNNLVKFGHDSVAEHNAKADAALLVQDNIYLIQFKSHHSQAILHFKKQCKVLVDYQWVTIQNPPVFWCDVLPNKLQLLQLLIVSGFSSQRFTFAKQAYTKLAPLKGKQVFPRTLQKNMGAVVDDMITLGLIRQRRDGTWVVV